MSGLLYIAHNKAVGLPGAVSALGPAIESVTTAGESVVALVYTPRSSVFARVNSAGQWEWPPDDRYRNANGDLRGEAYEVRLFCDGWEFRWLREGKTGRAALLSEDQELTSRVAGDETPVEIALYQGPDNSKDQKGWLDHTYLLWGQAAASPADGWTKLTSARIGTLWAPVPDVPEKGRVQLHAREYLVKMEHGNVVVAHERLTHLAKAEQGGSTDG